MALANGKHLLRYKVEIVNKSVMNISDENNEPIILNDLENSKVYLPGTTIAGAFRNYVNTNTNIDTNKLFGQKNLSKIFIYDSYADFKSYEIRPSVKINEFTGANENKSKFERAYIGEGHLFNLEMEVYADSVQEKEEYKNVIYELLLALDNGDIMIGSYKSIGAGLMEVKNIYEEVIDLEDKKQLFKYLKKEEQYKKLDKKDIIKSESQNIVTFNLIGNVRTPILIKGNDSLDYKRPDGENIRNSKGEYFIPGSSLKGVVRSEARKILRSINKINLEDYIFGATKENESKNSSKIKFFDAVINKETSAIYNRIKIDKFTGGVRKSAILNDSPLTGEVQITAKYYCKDSNEETNVAIGLLSVIFKNIAIGEVPFGSGNSIGRGRIDGNNLIIKRGNEVLYNYDFKKNEEIANNLDVYISALREA